MHRFEFGVPWKVREGRLLPVMREQKSEMWTHQTTFLVLDRSEDATDETLIVCCGSGQVCAKAARRHVLENAEPIRFS